MATDPTVSVEDRWGELAPLGGVLSGVGIGIDGLSAARKLADARIADEFAYPG